MYCRENGNQTVGLDGFHPHVKANASWAPEEQIDVSESPEAYWERLDAYE